MKLKPKKIGKTKNPTFASFGEKDFNKIIRASNILFEIINSQEKKKKESDKTEAQIQEFMSDSDIKMRKRFEDIVERIDKLAVNQTDKNIVKEVGTIKKLLTDIMIELMYIPI
jgi:hypothetical protein